MIRSGHERSDAGDRVAILFVHGAGQGAHAEDRSIVETLGQALGAHCQICYPAMPGEDDPDNSAWRRVIGHEAHRVGASIIVGHSAGGAVVADMLAQGLHGTGLPRLRGVVLLAPPFIGPGGWEYGGFHFEHPAREEALAGLPIFFYFGSSDTTVPARHADLYARTFPLATVRRLERCGHQFEGHLDSVAQDIRALVAP